MENESANPLPGELDKERMIEVRFFLLGWQSTELAKVNLPSTRKQKGAETSGDFVLSDFEKHRFDLRIKYFRAGLDAMSLIRQLRREGFGISYARHDQHQFWSALVLEFQREASEDLYDLLDMKPLRNILNRTFQQLEVAYYERGSVQQVITFGNQRDGSAAYDLTLDLQNGWVLVPKKNGGTDSKNSVQACA